MEKLLLYTALLMTIFVFAQKNNLVTKQADPAPTYVSQQKRIPKESSNVKIPKKVKAAFSAEYPEATGISWTKKKGIYIASFTHSSRRQTAQYYPDGRRIYTRRVVPAGR